MDFNNLSRQLCAMVPIGSGGKPVLDTVPGSRDRVWIDFLSFVADEVYDACRADVVRMVDASLASVSTIGVWVDLGLIPTVIGGQEFDGWLVPEATPRKLKFNLVRTNVSTDRIASADCATGAVHVRSVDDRSGIHVPPVVYEYALNLIKRMLPFLVSVEKSGSSLERICDEARRLVKTRENVQRFGDPLPLSLDGYGTMLRERLNNSSKQFEEAFECLHSLQRTALIENDEWLSAICRAIKLGHDDDAWIIWRLYQTYIGTPAANQHDRSAAVTERDRIVAKWSHAHA